MKYESAHGVTLPKIGFGTWSIGGGSSPDWSLDEASLAALRTALEVGYTHFDTAEYYAAGHAEELIARALQDTQTAREKVFLTSKVSPEHLRRERILQSCGDSLRRLQTDYIDLYLVHWPQLGMNLEEVFRALNQLVREGRVRRLGVSNFNLRLLEKSWKLSETPLLTNQVPYRLPDRKYVENGVLDFCRKNGMLLTAYSPLKFRRLRSDPLLREVAEAKGATVHQMALAWLVHQAGVITIPMSFDPAHIRENFEAADRVLSDAEFQRLSEGWSKGGGK